MLQKTRCKFYVSSRLVTSNHPTEGQPQYLNATVKLNAAYSPDPSTENNSFWVATPCGSSTLYLFGEEAYTPYLPGSFWYIDIWEDEDGDWSIKKLDKYDSSINVILADKGAIMYDGNKIELSISNKNVWDMFQNGKKYKAEFSPAVKC